MDVDAGSDASITRALAQADGREWQRLAPPVQVIRDGSDCEVALSIAQRHLVEIVKAFS